MFFMMSNAYFNIWPQWWNVIWYIYKLRYLHFTWVFPFTATSHFHGCKYCLLQPDDGHYITDLNVCTRLTLKISYKYVVTSSRQWLMIICLWGCTWVISISATFFFHCTTFWSIVFLLYYIYLIVWVYSYFADWMLPQSQSSTFF